MNCAKCGLIQGGVFVPSTYVPPEAVPAAGVEPGPPGAAPAEPSPAPPFGPGFASLSPTGPGFASPSPTGPGFASPSPTGPAPNQPATGWVPPYPIAPAPNRPLWRRVPIGLLIFGVLVVGGAVAGFVTNAGRSPTGDITKSGDMSSNDLRVGDCWDMKDPSADTIDNVTAKPCGEAHEYEVFFIGSMPDGSYPSDDQFSSYVQDNCVPAFGTYVGQTYDNSDLDISWLNPLSKGWTLGDRTVECSVYDPNNNQLTASMKGTGR